VKPSGDFLQRCKVYNYFHGESLDGHEQIDLATSTDGKSFTMLPDPVLANGPTGVWDDR
jgi:hypothetical protein